MKLKRFNTLNEAAQFDDPPAPSSAIDSEVADAVDVIIDYLNSKPVSERGKKLISELNALASGSGKLPPINQTV